MEYTKIALRGETKRTAIALSGWCKTCERMHKYGECVEAIAVTLECENGHQVQAVANHPEITAPDAISGERIQFGWTSNWHFCDDCTDSTLRSKESQQAGKAELIRILEGAN